MPDTTPNLLFDYFLSQCNNCHTDVKQNIVQRFRLKKIHACAHVQTKSSTFKKDKLFKNSNVAKMGKCYLLVNVRL